MRRASCLSVPMMCRPPAAMTRLCRSCHSRRSSPMRRSFAAASRSSLSRTRSICFSTLPPSTMSVPRPAMLVAIVTILGRPAWATISASRACCFAFRTWCGNLSFSSIPEMSSEFSIEVVPTSTGWPRSWQSLMSPMIALYFSAAVKDLVVAVGADHRHMRRNDDDLQSVDLLEFVGLGVGRSGHPRELAVHAEVILERDRRKRLVFALDRNILLGFDSLVQAVGPAAAGHQAAGELVDDDHLAVLDYVVPVPEEKVVRPERRVEVMHQVHVRRLVEAAPFGQQPCTAAEPFGVPVPVSGEAHGAGFLVDVEVARRAFR